MKSREIRRAFYVYAVHMNDDTHAHNFGWKPECKRPFRKPRRRWKVNINIDLKDTECEGTDFLFWLRIANSGALFGSRDEISGLIKGGKR
jgi:hypothetical protein